MCCGAHSSGVAPYATQLTSGASIGLEQVAASIEAPGTGTSTHPRCDLTNEQHGLAFAGEVTSLSTG